MKRKYGAIILAILMLFSFASCSYTVTEIENTTTSTVDTTINETIEIPETTSATVTYTDTSTTLKETSTTKNQTVSATTKKSPSHTTTKLHTTTKSHTTTKPPKTTTKVHTTTQKHTTTTTKVQTTQKTTVPTTIATTDATAFIPKTSRIEFNPSTTYTTDSELITCTIEISCTTILNNKDMLDESKAPFVPSDGVILKKTTVQVEKGATAFDVLKKVCAENHCGDNCRYCQSGGIQLEYRFTPAYDSYYIEGIHQLYEFDCGDNSGWMYSVNGVFPNKGCNQYTVKNGDTIKFLYTCSLGSDIGSDSF